VERLGSAVGCGRQGPTIEVGERRGSSPKKSAAPLLQQPYRQASTKTVCLSVDFDPLSLGVLPAKRLSLAEWMKSDPDDLRRLHVNRSCLDYETIVIGSVIPRNEKSG